MESPVNDSYPVSCSSCLLFLKYLHVSPCTHVSLRTCSTSEPLVIKFIECRFSGLNGKPVGHVAWVVSVLGLGLDSSAICWRCICLYAPNLFSTHCFIEHLCVQSQALCSCPMDVRDLDSSLDPSVTLNKRGETSYMVTFWVPLWILVFLNFFFFWMLYEVRWKKKWDGRSKGLASLFFKIKNFEFALWN